VRKSEPLKPEIPDDLIQAAVRRSRARGKTGQWGLVKFSARSLLSRVKPR
jgi:hypothetical protein